MTDYLIGSALAFIIGLLLGAHLEAIQWRRKGDHEYMNRKESGGQLYTVKRDD